MPDEVTGKPTVDEQRAASLIAAVELSADHEKLFAEWRDGAAFLELDTERLLRALQLVKELDFAAAWLGVSSEALTQVYLSAELGP